MILKQPTRIPKVPEGYQKVILDELEAKFNVSWYDRLDDIIEFTFKLSDGAKVTHRERLSLHKSSNLSKIVKELTGSLPDPVQGFDTDTVIGKECILLIEHYESKTGDIWERVKEIKLIMSDTLNGSI